MKIALLGLGRMGHNIALNLIEKKFTVIAYNRSPGKTKEIAEQGAIPAFTLKEACEKLGEKKVIMMMVTAGKPVDEMIEGLLPFLAKGDILIDAGNSFYKDSIRRHEYLKRKGIDFLDMGTSGGLEGARHGACLTIGGEEEVYEKLEALFKAIAAPKGYLYVGESGAGHFVKMVHNGIEYGMLQAYGEGFEVLEKGKYDLDYEKIARTWSHGSIIRSYLLELTEKAFQKDSKLEGIKGIVGGGETGTWALETGKELGAKTPVLEASLQARKESQKKESYSGKVIAAVRNEFGGHEVVKNQK